MSRNSVLNNLKKHKSFLISTHVNPDPDALCSELALAECLRSMNKKVAIINEELPLKRFDFFPGIKRIRNFRRGMNVQFDAVVVVDCGELSRIGKVQGLLDGSAPIINIDHHITNDNFGKQNYVVADASSTAEVLYGIIMSLRKRITKTIAQNLYAGIMTDTGSFRFENTTAKTHNIVGHLLRFSFSPTKIYQRIYETIPFNDLKQFTKVISGFDKYYRGQVICVELTQNIVKNFSRNFDLRDAIFKFLRSIEGVEVIAIFTQTKTNKTRLNLRSANHVDVAKIAHHFNGGGHKRASGGMLDKGIKESKKAFLKYLKRII